MRLVLNRVPRLVFAAKSRFAVVQIPGSEPVGAAQARALDSLYGLTAWGAGANPPGWGLDKWATGKDEVVPVQNFQSIPVTGARDAVAKGFPSGLPSTVAPHYGDKPLSIRDRMMAAGV